MAFQTSGLICDLPLTSASSNARFQEFIGRLAGFSVALKGEIYQCKLVEASATIAAGDLLYFIDGGLVAGVTTAAVTDATGVGMGLAVAAGAATSGQRFWACLVKTDDTDSTIGLHTLASMANDLRPNTTATAGAVDDDNTAGAFIVNGAEVTTDTGGSAAVNATSKWSNPYLSSLVI